MAHVQGEVRRGVEAMIACGGDADCCGGHGVSQLSLIPTPYLISGCSPRQSWRPLCGFPSDARQAGI